MRPVVVLALALVFGAPALAGCFNHPKAAGTAAVEPAELELPQIGTEHGTEFVTVGAPVWKPGYHFTYEEEGAETSTFLGDGFNGEEAHSESTSWGPRPGLNYTIVNDDTSFGQTRYLALHRDAFDGRPMLLSIEPEHLEPLRAYIGTYCAQVGNCSAYLSVWEDEEEAPPLTFPLDGNAATKQEVEGIDRPNVPVEPVQVFTRVLGFKDVDGPFGPVQAVHVHQEFRVNFTRTLQDWREEAEAGVTDLRLSGTVQASRDVFYAPKLLNVVLDQAVSQGEYNGSYQRDGKPQTFRESWRSWSAQRLTDVALEESPSTTLSELAGILSAGASHPNPSSVYVRAEADPTELNVAEGEATNITATLSAGAPPTTLRIDVFNSYGDVVATAASASLSFQPDVPGPYLAVAYSLDGAGKVLDVDSSVVYANYEGNLAFACEPVSVESSTACPGMAVPMGPSIAYLHASVAIDDPLAAANLPGRFVIEQGQGQEVSSDRQGDSASIRLWNPQPGFLDDEWTLRFKPDAGAQLSGTYSLEMWPSYLPTYVYQIAYGQT